MKDCADIKNYVVLKSKHGTSKMFYLGSDGELIKEPGGNIYDSMYSVQGVSNPSVLVDVLNNLRPTECISWSILNKGGFKGRIVSRANAIKGSITRTRDNFEFPSGLAVMMLDIDEVITFNELLEALERAMPGFKNAPYVTAHSASTFIYNGNTCLKGEGGKRVYIFVADGLDINRAAKVLGARLKIGGFLHYQISKSGSALERTLIDEQVYQPERLDFCGGAQCKAPLEQRRPQAQAFNNDAAPMNTLEVLPDLSSEESALLSNLCREKKAAIKGEADNVRNNYAEECAKEYVARMAKKGVACDIAKIKEKYISSIDTSVLADEVLLYCENGEVVSVGKLRTEPAKWHKKRFADPLEPTYNNDNRIAMAILKGLNPCIKSYAHGGRVYMFAHSKTRILIDNSNMPKIVEHCESYLAKSGVVYQVGGDIVRLSDQDSSVLSVKAPWLKNFLEIRFGFEKDGKDFPISQQCPQEVADRIIANRGSWTLPSLRSVTRLPFMRLDGSIVCHSGYDEETQVFLTNDYGHFLEKLSRPSKSQLKNALKRLYMPFREFPFAESLDVGVLLAAILTTAVRVALPTAPGFFIGAPVYGTGKSLLAESVAAMTGKKPRVMAWPDKEAEQRKALVSVLRESSENIILDNLVGSWNSTDLAAILTSQEFSDRLLGVSEMISVQTNCLVLATGNNVSVAGDLARRVLVITLNSREERPDQRTFDFDPLALVQADPLGFRRDALTVLRGYHAAKMPRVVQGGMGSFEEWEKLVRQAVCWVADEGLSPVEIEDPLLSINKNFEADVDTNRLRSVLSYWYAVAEDRMLTLRDLVALAEDDRNSRNRGVDQLGDDESIDCLYDMLYEVAGNKSEINVRMLSAWFSKRVSRVLDGMYLEKCLPVHNTARWRVVLMKN